MRPAITSWNPMCSTTGCFVGDGLSDDQRFLERRTQWIEFWNRQPALPWTLRVESLDGHNHFSAPPESFRRGIRWLFAEELASADH